jgi:hypothetical protein
MKFKIMFYGQQCGIFISYEAVSFCPFPLLQVYIVAFSLTEICAWMYSMRQNIHYLNEKANNIILLSSVNLFILKETNIQTISMLIYHGMRNVSVRSVHRLAVDKRTCVFEMREFQ